MQFIVTVDDDGAYRVQCPACATLLSTVSKQDNRVHVMLHPEAECIWANHRFRVDRTTGYAQAWPSPEVGDGEDDDEETQPA